MGVESAFDQELRGGAGEKAVLVNNLGYYQSENVITPVDPKVENVVPSGHPTGGAASAADLQPEHARRGGGDGREHGRHPDHGVVAHLRPERFCAGHHPKQWAWLSDETLRPQINRCTQENYAPGSIFKIVVSLAALEAEASASLRCNPTPKGGAMAASTWARRKIADTAPAGRL